MTNQHTEIGQISSAQFAGCSIQAESMPNSGYSVHLYATVRIPVHVATANSQADAIAQAEEHFGKDTSVFKHGEYADEITHVVVDSAEVRGQGYVLGETGQWIPEDDGPDSMLCLPTEAHDGDALTGKTSGTVSVSGTTITFSLPNDFGRGWGYTNVRLYGASHQWAGSYDKSVDGNFAHDALMLLPEVESSYLSVGMACNVDCKVTSLNEAALFQSRLQAVVDAFSIRPERQIYVRGSNYYDSTVTEHSGNEPEIEVVSDMPYLNYLAKYVPLAIKLPALSGHDLAVLRSQADEHQRAKRSV